MFIKNPKLIFIQYHGKNLNMEQINDTVELPVSPIDGLVADALKTTDKPLTEEQEMFKTFQDSLNKFIKLVGDFPGSKSQLQRVLINLAISPLNAEEFHFGYPQEKELFELGGVVNSSKFFLMLSGLAQQGKISFIEQPVSVEEKQESVKLEEEQTNG